MKQCIIRSIQTWLEHYFVFSFICVFKWNRDKSVIVTKPKVATLFSMGIFITASLSIAIFCIYLMMNSGRLVWYQFLAAIILGPVALGLLAKVILGYKIVSIGKERIEIKHPTRFSSKTYSLKEIDTWKETEVKTATGVYQELEVLFNNKKKLNLSYQEHTDYPAVIKYLKKKCARKFKAWEMFRNLLLVGLGGFFGSIFRYLTYILVDRNINISWPLATLSVNILGSLILGFIYGFLIKSSIENQEIRLLFAVGFCGSFTTFSTFAYENLQLLQQKDIIGIVFYIGASVVLGLLAAYGGFLLGKMI